MTYKKMFIIMMSLTCGTMLLYLLFIYYIDPYQFFSMPELREGIEERSYNPQMARNLDYDSVFTGTSLTQCFKPSELDSQFGWNTIRLSLSGSSAYEIIELSNYIESINKAKNYLLDLNINSYTRKITDRYRQRQPHFLLKETLFPYLFDAKDIKHSFKIFLKKIKCVSRDELYFWDYPGLCNREVTLRYYMSTYKPQNPPSDSTFISQTKNIMNNFEKNVLPFLKNANTKNITFFFPPFSILSYHSRNMNLEHFFKKFMIEKLSEYPNIKIYDFQTVQSITHHFELYKDLAHYNSDVSSWMVKMMAADSYRITLENVDSQIECLDNQIKSFDYDGLYQKILQDSSLYQ